MRNEASAAPLLSVRGLTVSFPRMKKAVSVVEDVSFDVASGEIVGLVGESGSGKSITARSLLRLVPPPGRITAGEILFRGRDIRRMNGNQVRDLRGADIAMVFQDPTTSLNPVLQIGTQIAETMRLHRKIEPATIKSRVHDLLALVGIPAAAERAHAYPHEFSGGMRQRAIIAMALANKPALIVADEPTTALDVTVQAQIVALLRDLNRQSGSSVLMITHNIALVARLCERMIVMYSGRIVEEGPVKALLAAPQHPYTWLLLRSMPTFAQTRAQPLLAITGQPPDPADRPTGCAFQPRCPFAVSKCLTEEPPLEAIGEARSVRCWVQMRNLDTSARP
jgi:oligopeptide/dipeptide ABC transporter ATP-binding protein